MTSITKVFLAIAILAFMTPVTSNALTPYSQDFETLDQGNVDALANDGWLIFANVFGPDGSYWYGYGTFPAPNDGAAFSAIVIGEGGAEQGDQQLSIFSDYNNVDHGNGAYIEANVFQEQIIEAEDVGALWVFDFDAKLGNLEGETTALAFIKTLDPNSGYAMTNFITEDMTNTSTSWTSYSMSIFIDEGLVGQILQIGFSNTATNYEGSGVFYDNINAYLNDPSPINQASWGEVKSLYREN